MSTAAKVYADALFSLCIETDTLEAVYQALGETKQVFDDNQELYQLLTVPTIPSAEKLSLVKRIFAGQDYVLALISMLTERERILLLPEICSQFEALYLDQNNIADMTVTTPVPLTDDLRAKLIQKLEKQSGKKVRLTEEVDPSILGGAVVRYGNTILDNSVKTQLDNMRRQLRQA